MKALCLSIVAFLACVQAVPAVDVRGPYLTNLRSDQATIVLHTGADADSVVQYREVNSNEGHTLRKESQGGRRHVFELKGLKPGTQYSYQIVNSVHGAGKSSEKTAPVVFATPPEAGSSFSFIVYGDSRDRRAPKRHQKIASNFLKHEPSFVLSTGDLLLGGTTASSSMFGDDWTLNFFLPLQQVIGKVPFLIAVGNHDQDAPDALGAIATAFPNLAESFHHTFRSGNTQFMVLHVANKMKEFETQKKWFTQEMEKSQDADWRIVFLHVSPFTNGKYRTYEWTLDGRIDFLKACVDARVDLVLSGHDHSYQRFHPLRVTDQDPHSVVFVVTALAGTNPYKAQEDQFTARVVNSTDHFCVIRIDGQKLSLTAYDSSNHPFDSMTILRENRNRGMVWVDGPVQQDQPND